MDEDEAVSSITYFLKAREIGLYRVRALLARQSFKVL